MFIEACGKFDYNTLINYPDHCFIFLLVHPENQITNLEHITSPYILHLNTWKRIGKNYMDEVELDISVPKPVYFDRNIAIEALKSDKPVITAEINNTKYIPSSLKEKYRIRGNDQNILRRWIILRSSGEHEKFAEILPYSISDQAKKLKKKYYKYINAIASGLYYKKYVKYIKEDGKTKFTQIQKDIFRNISKIEQNDISLKAKKLTKTQKKERKNNRISLIKKALMDTIDDTFYKIIMEHKRSIKNINKNLLKDMIKEKQEKDDTKIDTKTYIKDDAKIV
jgi:hypothetical protein